MKIMRKVLFIFLFVFFFLNALNVMAITGQKKHLGSNRYQVKFGSLGTYIFSGTSGNLITRLNLNQLKNFPGYQVMRLMNISNIQLKYDDLKLTLSGEIRTSGKLKNLFNILKIPRPMFKVSAELGWRSINLKARMPINVTIPVIPSLGTSLTFRALELGFKIQAELDKNKKGKRTVVPTPVLSITGLCYFKPSNADKKLKIDLTASYNLLNQQFALAGTLRDTWKNPFAIKQKLKIVGDIIIKNAALEIGYIPGSPTPTKVGIMAEKISAFGLDMGFAMDANPADGKVAFMMRKESMPALQFIELISRVLSKKFPFPPIPASSAVGPVSILFSPTGGTVGSLKISQGLSFKGEINLPLSIHSQIECRADFSKGAFFKIEMKTAKVKEYVLSKVKNIPIIQPIINQVLNTFNIRKIMLLLKASGLSS